MNRRFLSLNFQSNHWKNLTILGKIKEKKNGVVS